MSYVYEYFACWHIHSRPGVMGSWEPRVDSSYGIWISAKTVESGSTELSLYPHIKCYLCE